MTTYRSHAVILRETTHGESDKIITLFSANLGKITAIAKGAKRSKQRFVNKLEPFTLLRIIYRPPKNGTLFFLSDAELINAYISLRTDYHRYVTATFISELTQLFSVVQDPEPAIFTLLNWALHSLDQGMPASKTALLFLHRLLNLCGYQPQLDQCFSCKRSVEEGASFTLYPGNGNLLCSDCIPMTTASSLTLSIRTLKFLHSAQKLEIQQLSRLHLPTTNAREALNVLCNYSRHLLQQDIHSWKQFCREIG